MSDDSIRFGDTPHAVWLAEVVQNCLRELPGGRSGVDMDLLMFMCSEEPKNAQAAMQLLAYELKRDLGNKNVAQATGLAETYRLLLGCILLSYEAARGITDRVPPELNFIVKAHPIIMECATFVAEEQLRNKKPWWKFW